VANVALNDDYVGGALGFATPDGIQYPARPAGCATAHDNNIVHGVSPIESGIRYGLFAMYSA
jgi:predicted 2-oxoglutarate/Fe(II)-dependent dioxygenase YbiX